jgi:hypothetical protein
MYTISYADDEEVRVKKTDRVILEVREGARFNN